MKDTSERLFTDLGGTHYLTPIWVERETANGMERVTLNKTRAQKEKERVTKQVEKEIGKQRRNQRKEIKKHGDEILESEEDYYQNQGVNYPENYQNQGYNNLNYNQNDNHPEMNLDFTSEIEDFVDKSQIVQQESDFNFNLSEVDLRKDNSEITWKNKEFEDFDLDDEILE